MVAGEEAALALLAGAVSAVVLGGCSAAHHLPVVLSAAQRCTSYVLWNKAETKWVFLNTSESQNEVLWDYFKAFRTEVTFLRQYFGLSFLAVLC